MRRSRAQRGNTLLEFTLVGIPLIFLLISTFEMARGMWIYHTLAYAVREGTRYAVVHGVDCATAPNSCQVTVGQVAGRIRQAAPGLLPAQMSLVLTAANGTVTCALSDCLSNTSNWPSAPGSSAGLALQISAAYPYQSLISMLWPGGANLAPFGAFNLSASSKQAIQF
ncbi:MAG TPA: TadE/TadG family type IV pilus assembly protein [Bryobacteraceae bacterium]|nr:TadE/TadG family type IV pilus assembly protein [Bryobacteraceae bacterium]